MEGGISMERIHLVQRLKRPWDTESCMTAFSDSLAFGGGLINGGLTDEARGILGRIFRFDYMGASEFEWGAVPKALERISTNYKKYLTTTFQVVVRSGVEATVYAIVPKEHEAVIVEWIKAAALDEWALPGRLKESLHFDRALNGDGPYQDYVGWLELGTGFFFFVDEDTFKATAKIFGVR